MSDLVLVALFSAGGTAVVALSASIATIFGPAWRDNAQRRSEWKQTRNDRRFERAQALIEAVLSQKFKIAGATAQVALRRSSFLATLRKGEQPVAWFITRELRRIDRTSGSHTAPINEFADTLLDYLRGDLTLKGLANIRAEPVPVDTFLVIKADDLPPV